MNVEEGIARKLKSDDEAAQLVALWDIIYSKKDEVLGAGIAHIDLLRKMANQREQRVRSVRSDSWVAKLALEVVSARSEGRCRCSAYPRANAFLPKPEEKHGFITVLKERTDPASWQAVYECQCRSCLRYWKAEENNAYHYPTAKWKILDAV